MTAKGPTYGLIRELGNGNLLVGKGPSPDHTDALWAWTEYEPVAGEPRSYRPVGQIERER